MRYAVKGSNTGDVSQVSGQGLVGLMGRNITAGRAFWLTKVWYPSTGITSKVVLYDATIGTHATLALVATDGPTGPHPVIFLFSATEGVVTPTVTAGSVLTQTQGGALGGYMSFPSPGLKFSLGCCITMSTGATGANATIGSVGGEGYEE